VRVRVAPFDPPSAKELVAVVQTTFDAVRQLMFAVVCSIGGRIE